MSAIVQLDVFFALASSSARWTLRDGVVPTMETFDFEPADGRALLSQPFQPVTLTITGGDPVGTLEVKYLYVITEVASEDPNIVRVLVADRRWWWSYRHVLRRFNIRARTGDARRVAGDDTPAEVQPVVQDVWYKPWSTRDGRGKTPWTAPDAVRDVIEWVLGKEKERTSYLADLFVEDTSFGGKLNDVPIENAIIDTTGDRAVRQILGFLPEATVRVEPSGRVVVYSRASGRELDQVNRAGAESVDRGHVQFVSNARQMPSLVRVYYSREVELRHDFEELETKGGSSIQDPDKRSLDNVIPIPDFSLEVSGRTLQNGTWLPLPDALTAWGPIGSWGELDLPFIRRAMVPYRDLWSVPVRRGNVDTEADWMPRVSAIARHFRQTYRLAPAWAAKLLSLRAYRVGIIDGETGTRAPAIAYADYFRLGGDRIKLGGVEGYPHETYGVNVKSYPRGGGTPPTIDSDTKPCPAGVSVLDEDQGIIHLSYLVDPARLFEACLPGFVAINGAGSDADGVPIVAGPTAKLSEARQYALGWDLLPTDNPYAYPTLKSGYKVAVILTGLPGAPNDIRQLHMEEVTPQEVASLLPPALRQGLGNAQGPVMELRVGATPETTARVKWDDAWAEKVDSVFGVGGEPDTSIDLSPITVNLDTLRRIALSSAASVYASMADRPYGAKTTSLAPQVQLEGMISEVVHEVTPDGDVETRIRIRESGAELDVLATLPYSYQANLLRLAQPGGQG